MPEKARYAAGFFYGVTVAAGDAGGAAGEADATAGAAVAGGRGVGTGVSVGGGATKGGGVVPDGSTTPGSTLRAGSGLAEPPARGFGSPEPFASTPGGGGGGFTGAPPGVPCVAPEADALLG